MYNDKPDMVAILSFFGKKPGQTLIDFNAEIKTLSATDKQQLAKGIKDDTFTY